MSLLHSPWLRAGVFAAAAVVFGGRPTLCQAQTAAAGASYDARIQAAVTEFNAGNWQEARVQFLKAHELEPNARTLRGLGMVEFELRHYTESIRYLDAALADPHRPLPENLRAEVEQLRARAKNYVGTYRIRVSPAAATLTFDGKAATPQSDGAYLLDLGAHVLEVSAPGFASARRELDVAGGDSRELEVTLVPAAASAQATPTPTPTTGDPTIPAAPPTAESRTNVPAWILVGGGAAMVGAGLTVGVLALGAEKDFRDDCPKDADSCDPALQSKRDKAKDLALVSDILWIGGAAVAAGGVTWLLLGSNHETRASAGLIVTPEGGFARVGGVF